jgi:PST family polysaccharide transporter
MGLVGVLTKNIFSGILWQFITIGICIVAYFAILFIFPDMRKTIFELACVKKILNKFRR